MGKTKTGSGPIFSYLFIFIHFVRTGQKTKQYFTLKQPNRVVLHLVFYHVLLYSETWNILHCIFTSNVLPSFTKSDSENILLEFFSGFRGNFCGRLVYQISMNTPDHCRKCRGLERLRNKHQLHVERSKRHHRVSGHARKMDLEYHQWLPRQRPFQSRKYSQRLPKHILLRTTMTNSSALNHRNFSKRLILWFPR